LHEHHTEFIRKEDLLLSHIHILVVVMITETTHRSNPHFLD